MRDVKDDCFSSLKTFHKDLYSAITSIKQSKSRISEVIFDFFMLLCTLFRGKAVDLD